MMDAIFRAGRALGRAEAMRLNEKDGASYVHDAISEMNRSSNAGVRGVVTHAQGLVNNWVRHKDELPGLTASIRDTHLLGTGDNKGYQSFLLWFAPGAGIGSVSAGRPGHGDQDGHHARG